MIHSSAEARAARLYLLLLPAFTVLLMLSHMLCALLPPVWGLSCAWLVNLALAFAMPLCIRRFVLSAYPAAPLRMEVDGRLLLDKGYAVHHVLCPLEAQTQARVAPGSSMLLLSTCAMLTLPREAQSPEHRAILRFLRPLGMNQNETLAHYPKARSMDEMGLHWSVHHDGSNLRAYACGAAEDVLAACTLIWDGEARTLTEEDRTAIRAQLAAEGLPPIGFAMADMCYGKPGQAVFLGAFLMDLALSRPAAEDIRWLTQRGMDVTLGNLPPMTLMRFSSLLGCPTHTDEVPDIILTTDTEQSAAPGVLAVMPGATIMQAVKGLSRLRIRMRRQMVIMAVTLTTLYLCCLVCGLPALEMGLMHEVLCIAAVLPLVMPAEKRLPSRRKALLGHALSMALVLSLFSLCSLFVRSMSGVQTGACVLFLLPVILMLMLRDIRQSAAGSMRLSIAVAAVLTALLGLVTCLTLATSPLAAAFMLIAGTLCAILAGFLPLLL